MIPVPSFDRLDELLTYDPEDGQLRWKVRRSNVKAGSLAGCIRTMKNGRQDWTVMVDYKLYTSTRIIWMLYYRQDPGLLSIDHVNQNPLDNRISNLRLATVHEQNLNTRCTSPSTATRHRGIIMHSHKNTSRRPQWQGKIRIAGRLYSFGSAPVDSIDNNPPDWLIARASRLYTMRDNPAISDEDLIKEIRG